MARRLSVRSLLPFPCVFLAGVAVAQATAPEAERPRGVVTSEAGAFQGYTMFAPLRSHATVLIDMQGRVVHRWPGTMEPSAVYLLDDGSLLRSVRIEPNKTFRGGGICGRVERVAWDGTVVWSYDLASEDQTHHHDAFPMPNGNVLVIAWEFRYREDVLAAGRAPVKVPDKGFWPDALLEVKPTLPSGGEVVWEWHVWDHLVQDLDPELDRYGSVADSPGRIDINADHRDEPPMSAEEREKQEQLEEEMRALGYTGGDEEEEETPAAPAPGTPAAAAAADGVGSDWLHTNAVAYNATLDLVMLSTPHLSELWIVDHSTTTDEAASDRGGKRGHGGEILWRWGNPRTYGAGTAADQRLFFQHNAHWIPEGLPGGGHVLVFNNGQGRPGGEHSSIDELALPFDAEHGFQREPGHPFGPTEPAWSYAAPQPADFYGSFISGCQRLPNGNTLICQGPDGRLFEVTPAGAIVWEYWNEHGGDAPSSDGGGGVSAAALFRATRIAPDHPALKGRKLEPEPAR
jgi:hypothetical protein